MKVFSSVGLCLAVVSGSLIPTFAQEPVVRARTPIKLPQIPGYVSLKCDFHLHTVFSDGLVWPTVRVEEAWRDGLDVIAITDHLEYQPYKTDITTNHNRSYEVARQAGHEYDVLVVKGSEVTREMPPGHLNAIFLTDATPLAVPDWREALKAAHRQGAFIFLNHPGWAFQSPDGKARWYPEHAELLEQGLLQGIEVVNGRSYYPEAHRFAMEHKLTMFSNSDAHKPTGLDYPAGGDFRPVTVVFAKEKTIESLKEALLAQRTVVYSQNRLIGTEEFLKPIFEGSIQVLNPKVRFRGSERRSVQIQNSSEVNYLLELCEDPEQLDVPRQITLPAGKTVLLEVSPRGGKRNAPSKVALDYKVKNLLCGPDKPLRVTIEVEVL